MFLPRALQAKPQLEPRQQAPQRAQQRAADKAETPPAAAPAGAAASALLGEPQRWPAADAGDLQRIHSPTVSQERAGTGVEPAPTEDGDEVKAWSWQQRAAAEGEPRCAVCGRYGEYVCDATDDDVCSLECKAVVLERAGLPTGESLLAMQQEEGSGQRDTEARDLLLSRLGVPVAEPLTEPQAVALRKNLRIVVQGHHVPVPVADFGQCGLPNQLLANLDRMGFDLPTPVQMQVLPAASKRRHLLVCAPPGSGKTAAFLLPMISHIARAQLERQRWGQDLVSAPLGLVLAPTRELCSQIEEQAKELARGLLGLRTALLVGGLPLPPQLHRLRQGCQLLVATPGRMLEVLSAVEGEVGMDRVALLVLDEADTLLQQVQQIVLAVPTRQVLLFSATVDPVTEKFVKALHPPGVHITVQTPEKAAVQQLVLWVENKDKRRKLSEIIRSPQHFHPPALVFVASRAGAELLAAAVEYSTGVGAAAIHGQLLMARRRAALADFVGGKITVLVSTGVLGRGMDLLSVHHVIIYDMPRSVEELSHWVGRAGRGGRLGRATLFVNSDDGKLFPDLVPMLKAAGAAVPQELRASPFLQSGFVALAASRKRRKGS